MDRTSRPAWRISGASFAEGCAHDADQLVQTEPLALSRWERLGRIADAVDATLRAMDGGTASLKTLDTIQPLMAGITSEVRAYIADQNIPHLEGANITADGVLQQLPLLATSHTAIAAERVSESLARLDRVINEQ